MPPPSKQFGLPLKLKKNYDKRPDGSSKGTGKQIDFPTLVPTLSKDEIFLMQNEIIPNKKPIPEAIMQKAIEHAKMRLAKNLSPFK
jgi:hypothetical protein